MTPELSESLRTSRVHLRGRCPFFSVLISHLRTVQVPDDDPTVRTAAVGGDTMYVNWSFWRTLSLSERNYVMAHEVLHLALGHLHRCGARNLEKWNVAADYAVAVALDGFGFGMPPKGGLYDARYKGLSAETIYDMLSEDPGQSNNDLMGDGGEIVAASVWKRALAQAKTAQKLYGSSSHRAALECVEEPSTVDWRKELARALVFGEDLDRFDRRFLGRGEYVEDGSECEVYDQALSAICVDTSGSTVSVLGKFIGELRELAELMNPKIFDVYYADVDPIGPHKSTESAAFEPVGGGGTSFVPFFERIAEKGYTHVVYLTDLCGEFPEEVPRAEVMWVVPPGGSRGVPFGTVVEIVG